LIQTETRTQLRQKIHVNSRAYGEGYRL